MESSPKPIRLQDLQDHTESLQALALRLVGDEASAQDLVQDTLVTAVERPQRRVRALGAWLKTVLRHRAYRLRSSDRSRRLRERTASRVEADSAAPDALVERIELQAASETASETIRKSTAFFIAVKCRTSAHRRRDRRRFLLPTNHRRRTASQSPERVLQSSQMTGRLLIRRHSLSSVDLLLTWD